jgi:hypothetical protein
MLLVTACLLFLSAAGLAWAMIVNLCHGRRAIAAALGVIALFPFALRAVRGMGMGCHVLIGTN